MFVGIEESGMMRGGGGGLEIHTGSVDVVDDAGILHPFRNGKHYRL